MSQRSLNQALISYRIAKRFGGSGREESILEARIREALRRGKTLQVLTKTGSHIIKDGSDIDPLDVCCIFEYD